ncbi:serine hydrolase domain-containing protein [Aquimarina sp. W85]|uniref:serine hydrolase domain-containing protein n=1 Tax=Aquimarina rhodophyticola TaxID=3342246 RepID=UPI00366F0042
MKYLVKTCIIAPLLFTISALSIQSQELYFPEKFSWTERTPETFSINPSLLNQAIDYAKQNEYSGSRDLRQAILKGFENEPYHTILGPTKKRGAPAGMILQDGFIVARWGDIKRVDMAFSVTKSFLSTIAGLAYKERLLQSFDDLVSTYVWDETFEGVHNKKITWRHLLTQSSDWSGQLWGGFDWADRPPKNGEIEDWKSRTLQTPGSVFEYNDVRVNVLAYSLLQVWRRPLPQILKEKIMDPIDASTTWRWYGYDNSFVTVDGVQMQSVSGGGHSGGGMFINTLDLARFGLLFLANGKWNDKQLLPEDWIDQLSTPSLANANYGYMWWLNKKGARQWKNLPDHLFYAAGFGGNFIVVDKQKKLVIITRWLEPKKIETFLEKVYNAL